MSGGSDPRGARQGDTNVLLRYSVEGDPQHRRTLDALARLRAEGDHVVIASQNIAEFWAVATRPLGSPNGLGYTPSEAKQAIDHLLTVFERLPDLDSAFPIWLDLASRYGVSGKATYDARLVATMLANGVTRILTFNGAHFARFAEIMVEIP